MMILKVSEMRDFEDYTMDVLDLSEVELMQKAGLALTSDFIERAKPKIHSKISMILGIGNNGGDGLVMTLELLKRGFKPNVFVVGDVAKASKSFEHYLQFVKSFVNLNSIDDFEDVKHEISDSDFIVDGIFGLGLQRRIEGYRVNLIQEINKSNAKKYSIDIPSGLNPANGMILGEAVHADFTGVIGYYKLGNLLNMALDIHGKIKVLDIGIIAKYIINRQYVELDDQHLHVPEMKHGINKYTMGMGLFIGGRNQMMGSIQMSAMAGLKSGLGISYVGSDLRKPFTQFYPEIIIVDHQENDFLELIDRAKVIVFGPGIETDNQRYQEIFAYLMSKQKPLIIDASGLQYLDLNKDYENSNIILTPHVGEMARLFNVSTEDILKDPLKYVDILTKKGYHVILKGQTTIIASIDEMLFFQAKNPGLATAGSGDVLSGILAGYAAHYDLFDTMVQAVTIHSRAGMLAKERFGMISMTATNIIEFIHEVLMKG